MSVYAITFRISSDDSTLGTYAVRYQSLVDAIKKEATGSNYWLETTSFALIESTHATASALATALDTGSKISPSIDLLVVVNLSSKGYRIIGNYNDKDIDKIMGLR